MSTRLPGPNNKMKNVQDIYPATPMQELMLLHAIGQRHSDRLLSQFGFRLPADVDVTALEAAWNAVVARHPMLRTAFVTRKVPAPLQVVRQRVRVPFVVHDWRDHDDAKGAWEDLRGDDRREGIDTQRAPLMRVTLVRMGDDDWRMLWTSHHLLMDRWCLATLFEDLDRAYLDARRAGGEPVLPAAPSFRQYVDWLSERDAGAALSYWRDTLRGFTSPTPLASEQPDGTDVTASSITLDASRLEALQSAARRFAVSPVAVVQGALALVMATRHGRGDVVFGAAAAARPPAIANVESIVGSFVNNLPVRVRSRRDQTVREWLRTIAQSSFSRTDAEFVSPLAIAELATLPDNAALFDTLFVWLAPTSDRLPLDMTSLWDDMATAYPLTVSVAESSDALTLYVHQYASDPGHGESLLGQLSDTLSAITACDAQATLATLLPAHVRDAPLDGAGDIATRDAITADADVSEAEVVAGRFQIPEVLVRQLVEHQFAQALDLDAVAPDDDFF
ncbi:MAG: condensation domain-containing protein, partial [Pseudomonadota bacterium]